MGCQAWVQPLKFMFCWVAYLFPKLALHWLVPFLTHFMNPALSAPNLGLTWLVLA